MFEMQHQRDAPHADAGQCDPDRQPHRQHGAERQDQDHDRERQAQQLGLGRGELLEQIAAVLDPHSVEFRRQVGHLGAQLLGRDQVQPSRDLDRRVGDGPGAVALGRDALGTTRELGQRRRVVGTCDQPLHQRRARVVGLADEGARDRDIGQLADLGQVVLERLSHRRVVEARLGLHDDRALDPRAQTTHLGLQDVEASLRLDVRQAQLGREVRSHRAGRRATEHEHEDPDDHHGAAAARAPRTESMEHEGASCAARRDGSVGPTGGRPRSE